MKIEQQNTEQRPYRGMQTFTEEHKNLFFGRTKPVNDIFDLLRNNLLTVIFGKSGIGKSSLVNAGLIPKLRENFYLPVLIRIPFSDFNVDPLAYTRICIEAEMRKYIRKDFEYPSNTTLWQFFREADYTGGSVVPVLIFDQFEEYFNFGRENKQLAEKFIKELSDLIENRIPAELTNADTYKTLNAADTQNIIRVVISLREDFLAPLEDVSKLIPSLNKIRYRILQLCGNEAFDAVYLPAKNLIDEDTTIHLLRKIIPKRIQAETDSKKTSIDTADKNDWQEKDFEPYILSLFCYQVNEKRIAGKQNKISKELINQVKVEAILRDYYISSLKKYGRKYHKNFGPILEKNLISDEGYRLLKPSSANEFKEISQDAMSDLIDDRIIHRESRNDLSYIEISHDLLAKVIYDRKIENRENKRSFITIGGFILGAAILFTIIYFTQEHKNYEKLQKSQVELKAALDSLKQKDSLAAIDSIKINSLNTKITNYVTGDTLNSKNSGTVYFQVNWNASQRQVVLCMEALRKLKFTVPAPPEVKSTKPARNLIRYYHAEDEINADLIKNICDHYYSQPFIIQFIPSLANRSRLGTIEVWVIYEHHYQQIFSDTSAVSQSAMTYIIGSYKTVDVNKQWPKQIVQAARTNASDKNGIYKALQIFSKMDADYLSNDRELIISWLKEVERTNDDPKYKQLISIIYRNLGVENRDASNLAQ